ncbi:MAG: redoxin domain-containing protein [Bacteroidales bacterium]
MKYIGTIIMLMFLTLLNLSLTHGLPASDEGKDIEVMDFDTFSPRLEMHNDSIYVINFWATWCPPCVRELPALEQLNETYSGQKVKVILVSLDNPDLIDDRVLPFLERLDLQSEVILLDDPNSNRWIPLVSDEWSGAIPATVIYSSGYRSFHEREFEFEELEELVLPLIR